MTHHARLVPVVISLIGVMSGAAQAQYALRRAVDGRPDATIDLRTRDGAALVRGQWRYADARLTEVEALGPGADLKPTGRPVRTYDQVLKAGAIDFDDSEWTAIEAPSLEERRSTGKISFAWYRFSLTVPESVGGLATRGTTMVFEIVVDDYAEIWVDGQLPRTLGQTGGSLVKGFNAPNRVVLTRDAQPGQRIQLAVFAANGPLSDPPPNFIWVRSASLDFYKPGAHYGPVDCRDHHAGGPRSRYDRPGWRADRAARRRLPLHRRPRLGAGRIPALQRSERQHHLPLVGR